MKRVLSLAVLTTGMALLSGCVSYINQVPGAAVPLKPLESTATYDVLGDAKGTATGAYLFGFIPLGMESKSGSIGYGLSMADPVQQIAVYNAIESVPTADALIAPRFDATVSNYIIYREKTVTVKGKAIRYNPSVK